MKLAGIKALIYVFICSLLAAIIINSATDKEDTVWNIIKLCCFGIAGLVILIYLYMIVYLAIDNKQLAKLLNADDYPNIIKYASKKASKKTLLFAARKEYYNYLLLLSYLALDDTEQIEKYFGLVSDYYNYPVTLYWKSVYNFSKGDTLGLEANYDSFVRSQDVQKRHASFVNLIKILEVLMLYKNEKYEEAKKMLESVDIEHIAMPMTRRALAIVQEKEI